MLSRMSMWLNSLSLKILFAYVLGVVLSILLITVAILWLILFQVSFLASNDIEQLTQEMSQKLKFDDRGIPIKFDTDGDDLAWIFESLKKETAFRVLDAVGNPIVLSPAGYEFWPAKTEKPGNDLSSRSYEFTKDGILFHTSIATTEHQGRTWYVQFAVSERFFFFMHRGFALPFMVVGIIVFSVVLLCVFGACAFFTLRYTLRPLRDASLAAGEISPRTIHSRLSADGMPTEIVPLITNFNKVLDRLENGFRIQQEFLATAAHELKTPLALIRAQAEMQQESSDREALLNDVMHMTRHVQQLLLLAEVSEFQNYYFATVDINPVAREAVNYLIPMARAAGVKLTLPHPQSVEWTADRAAVFTLLKNLLENAIQHSPPDSEVVILVNSQELMIRDSGPGVEKDKLPRIFDRFWRGAHRRDHGSGLGLTICKEIVIAHGWEIFVENGDPGLRIRILRL